jgi:hypothetical protein
LPAANVDGRLSFLVKYIAMTTSRSDLEKLERQMIPVLNTIRAQLGKPPVIVPKDKPRPTPSKLDQRRHSSSSSA